MISPTTLFLNKSNLFDFDLTFIAELTLFFILAIVVTFKFITPISKEIDDRAEFVNYTLRKSTILLTFGYEKLSECVSLLTEEINEMNRQIKLTRNFCNSKFLTWYGCNTSIDRTYSRLQYFFIFSKLQKF